MIRLLTRFVARDEAAAAGCRDLLLRLKGSVPSEPNTLAYEVYASADDPLAFFCLESWAAQEDADRHIARNASEGVTDKAAALLARPPETTALRPLDADR